MTFHRLMTGSAIVALVGAGGLYTIGSEVHGQVARETRTEVKAKPKHYVRIQDGMELATLAGSGSRIGVSVRDVEASDVTGKKLSAPSGAVVDEIQSETPAAKAGLRAGDVVVSFDGERVRSARQLGRLVDETPAGRAVALSVMRDGAKVDLTITPDAPAFAHAFVPNQLDGLRWKSEDRTRVEKDLLDKLRDQKFDRFSGPAFEFDWDSDHAFAFKARGRLGVTAESVSDQLASYFGVTSGVLVQHVAEDSAAAKAGVKAGDVITAVNGSSVKDPADLRRLVTKAEGEALTLSITRDKRTMSLKATIEKPEETRPRVRRIV